MNFSKNIMSLNYDLKCKYYGSNTFANDIYSKINLNFIVLPKNTSNNNLRKSGDISQRIDANRILSILSLADKYLEEI